MAIVNHGVLILMTFFDKMSGMTLVLNHGSFAGRSHGSAVFRGFLILPSISCIHLSSDARKIALVSHLQMFDLEILESSLCLTISYVYFDFCNLLLQRCVFHMFLVHGQSVSQHFIVPVPKNPSVYTT